MIQSCSSLSREAAVSSRRVHAHRSISPWQRDPVDARTPRVLCIFLFYSLSFLKGRAAPSPQALEQAQLGSMLPAKETTTRSVQHSRARKKPNAPGQTDAPPVFFRPNGERQQVSLNFSSKHLERQTRKTKRERTLDDDATNKDATSTARGWASSKGRREAGRPLILVQPPPPRSARLFPAFAAEDGVGGSFARFARSSQACQPTRGKGVSLNLGGVGVGAQALSADAGHDVHEAPVVLHALLRPVSRGAACVREKGGRGAHTAGGGRRGWGAKG